MQNPDGIKFRPDRNENIFSRILKAQSKVS